MTQSGKIVPEYSQKEGVNNELPFLAQTVSRDALLVGGSDRLFRELINNLLQMSKQLQSLRSNVAERLGVTEPQYRVFTTVAQLQGEMGVSVGSVASALRVTGAFVTAEAGKLVRAGMLNKIEDPSDRRSVLLSLSEYGEARFCHFSKSLQTINDELFHDFTGEEFRFFAGLVQRLVTSGDRVGFLSQALVSNVNVNPVSRENSAGEIRRIDHDD